MTTVDRTFDAIDIQLLAMLQENARISQADMARAVGLAPSAVLERLRKLEHPRRRHRLRRARWTRVPLI